MGRLKSFWEGMKGAPSFLMEKYKEFNEARQKKRQGISNSREDLDVWKKGGWLFAIGFLISMVAAFLALIIIPLAIVSAPFLVYKGGKKLKETFKESKKQERQKNQTGQGQTAPPGPGQTAQTTPQPGPGQTAQTTSQSKVPEALKKKSLSSSLHPPQPSQRGRQEGGSRTRELYK